MTWDFNKYLLISFLLIAALCVRCGDDACGYDLFGGVKESVDSLPISGVNVTQLYFNIGDRVKGNDSSVFITDSEGDFSFEGALTPQRAYSCPEANEIELRLRYEKSGYRTIDTLFEKGELTSGGTRNGRKTVILPNIYLQKQ